MLQCHREISAVFSGYVTHRKEQQTQTKCFFFFLFSLTCSGNIICTKRENDIFTATIHIFMVIEAKHSSITIPFYQINLGFMSFVVSITLSSHIDGKVPLVREIQI